jgi:hypothetical protein
MQLGWHFAGDAQAAAPRVPVVPALGASFYQLAADQGHAIACTNLVCS